MRAIPDPPAARPSVLLLPSTAVIRRLLWLRNFNALRLRIATLPRWLWQSVEHCTATLISILSMTNALGTLPWTRVITMHFRRTLQRAWYTPSTGRCQTSSDHGDGAGTGGGSCPFFMFAGASWVTNSQREVLKLRRDWECIEHPKASRLSVAIWSPPRCRQREQSYPLSFGSGHRTTSAWASRNGILSCVSSWLKSPAGHGSKSAISVKPRPACSPGQFSPKFSRCLTKAHLLSLRK